MLEAERPTAPRVVAARRSPRVRRCGAPGCARAGRGPRPRRRPGRSPRRLPAPPPRTPAPSSPPSPMDTSAGTGTRTKRFSQPVGRHGRVGRGRLADVDRRRVRDAGGATEDVAEVAVPVGGEEQRVVGELREAPLDAEHREHRTRAGGAAPPRLLRVRLQRVAGAARSPGGAGPRRRRPRRQGRYGGSPSDSVARPPSPGTGHGVSRHAVRMPVTGAPVCSRAPCRSASAAIDLDEPGEPALRVEHPVAEVEPAHQVVHARRPARGRAEEHRGVAEQLAEPGVGELRRRRGCSSDRVSSRLSAGSGARRRGAGATPASRSCCRGSGASATS